MVKKVKLMIIDFDDCLCQTEAACFEFENKIVEKNGVNSYDPLTTYC